MRRLTTPTHVFELNGIDMTTVKKIKITYSQQKNVILEKRDDDLTIDRSSVSVKLTQEDTKKFSANYPVEMQLRILTVGDDALASDILTAGVMSVLDDEVMA